MANELRNRDAPQNLAEFYWWRAAKQAHTCDDHYLFQVNRKWRTIGRLARQPASLRNVSKI